MSIFGLDDPTPFNTAVNLPCGPTTALLDITSLGEQARWISPLTSIFVEFRSCVQGSQWKPKGMILLDLLASVLRLCPTAMVLYSGDYPTPTSKRFQV